MKITLKGTQQLLQKCDTRRKKARMKEGVRTCGMLLETKMKQEARFGKGRSKSGNDYSTGATQQSITRTMSADGLSVEVRPTTHYSFFLEYGTRFMLPEPFVNPAFNQVKPLFDKAMKKAVRS